MTYIWEERTDLKGAELLLAVAIADHADNDGRCFPGIKSLCLKMRLKERQVQDLIKRLEKKNVFNVERGNGRGHLTEFKMKKVQDSASITPTKKVQKTTPIEEEKGAGFCKKRVQDSATPIYKEEPLIESSSSSSETKPKTDEVEEVENDSYQPERTRLGFIPKNSTPSRTAAAEIQKNLDWLKEQKNLVVLTNEQTWSNVILRCDKEKIDFQAFYQYIDKNKNSNAVTVEMMLSDNWVSGFKSQGLQSAKSTPNQVVEIQIKELLATQAKRPLRNDESQKLNKLQGLVNV